MVEAILFLGAALLFLFSVIFFVLMWQDRTTLAQRRAELEQKAVEITEKSADIEIRQTELRVWAEGLEGEQAALAEAAEQLRMLTVAKQAERHADGESNALGVAESNDSAAAIPGARSNGTRKNLKAPTDRQKLKDPTERRR